MKKRLLSLAVIMVFVATAMFGVLPVQASTVEEGEGHNVLKNFISVLYDVPAETEGWQLDGSFRVTTSGHKIGNWGSYDGWKIVPGEDGGAMQYDFQGTEEIARISQFYTMISNYTKGLTRITLEIEKLQAGEILDLGIKFYDVVSASNTGETDFTQEYNAAPVGETVKLTEYVDLSLIGSPDSFIVWAKADTAAVQFQLKGVTLEWGNTAIATADGYFRGLDSGFNILFDKLARSGQSKNFVGMPVNGYSTEIGAGYDSGVHGDYGFNHGGIKAYNDEQGEYLGFGEGEGEGANSVSGIWIKFPLDLSREKVNLRFTIMKKVEGACNEVKFEFCSAGEGGSNVAVAIGNNHSYEGIPQLNDVPAGEWVTYDVKDVDLTAIATFDGLGIWVDATGAEGQEIFIRNLSIYYDECGADRSFALTEEDNEVNGLTFSAPAGVTVQSDYRAAQYLTFDYAAANGTVSASYDEELSAGRYRAYLAFRKGAALSDELSFSVTAGGHEFDLSSDIAAGQTDEWTVAESEIVELADGTDGFTIETSCAAGSLDVAYVALVQEEEYIGQDTAFGVSNVLVRNFTAMNNMGVDEYDFSQNGFPEIGNWSDSFPDLRSQGQKVVRDTDGTPVMKIYRRSQAEIEEAKELYDWPEGTNYVPNDQSHFFVTAPVSAGYFQLQVTVKKGDNFKGTADFSMEGYTGSEPWWDLANFTAALAEAEANTWVTFTADVYLPRAIDSIKICTETRYEDSDLFIKDLKVIRKQTSADGYYAADEGADLTWNIIAGEGAIDTVTLDGAAVPESAYTLTADAFTLKKDYLAMLANGTFEFVLSGDEGAISLTVYVSKVSPVIGTKNISVNLKNLKDLTIDVDFKGSGVSYIELNGRELEEDVDYILDADAGKLTLKPSAFDGVAEGEATLVINTRAGQAQTTIAVESKGANTGLIVGLSVGGAVVVAGIIVIAVVLAKKKKNAQH